MEVSSGSDGYEMGTLTGHGPMDPPFLSTATKWWSRFCTGQSSSYRARLR